MLTYPRLIQHFAKGVSSDIQISDKEAELLAWSVRSTAHSPEKAYEKLEHLPEMFEIRRAIPRLYCLDLLRKGKNYDAFIAAQPDNNPAQPRLDKHSFDRLHVDIARLDKVEMDVLRVTTLISSVPLSPEAQRRAKAAGVAFPFDSVEFLAATFDDIDKAKLIYPLVQALFDKHPLHQHEKIAARLKAAFAHHMHFRHMMYTEGNQWMFKSMKDKIAKNQLSRKDYHFWYCHWLINITGFRGQVNMHGSNYLHQQTFNAISVLKNEVDQLFLHDDHDVYKAYLIQRAAWLGLEESDFEAPEVRLFVARLGTMLRLFTKEDGAALLLGVRQLDRHTAQALIETCKEEFAGTGEITPTYLPALLGNAIDGVKQHQKTHHPLFKLIKTGEHTEATQKAEERLHEDAIIKAITIFMPIYLKAISSYRQQIAEDIISADTPLSFKDAADQLSVGSVLALKDSADISWHHGVDVTLDEKGVLAIKVTDDKRSDIADPRCDNWMRSYPQVAKRCRHEASDNDEQVVLGGEKKAKV